MEKTIVINGVNTNYTVTEDGKIFNKKTGRELKGSFARNEYHSVQLTIDGKPKSLMVHRLVAEAFCENPNNYTIVDHINRDKHDNRAENLRWVTLSQNNENCKKARNDKHEYFEGAFDENWKEFLNLYMVSNTGIVVNKNTKLILKPQIRSGYLRFYLKGKLYSIHRVVYQLFKGEISEKAVVDHIDGNRQNNHISNLRAVTQTENMINAQKNGHKGQIGVTQFSIDGKELQHFKSLQDAANFINVTNYALNSAANYGTKSGGYFWLKDNSITTKEEFIKLRPNEAVKYKDMNKTYIYNNNLYSKTSEHLIPKFKDEKGIYCFICQKNGSYEKEYLCIPLKSI